MSATAKLKINGLKEINVLSLSFTMHKGIDDNGKPVSKLHGGEVNISCEVEDNELFGWIIKGDPKDGEITFSKAEVDQDMIKLKWTKGYITVYSVGYGSGAPISVNFTVSAQKIDFGGTAHDNKWA
ncbi:MAG: type VI secretion system tube protein TssD [Chitinophagales bacterium]|nr:type VI secretion system tube protein TssD [Chitinophagales bacterium]